jgi:hypothetical protein
MPLPQGSYAPPSMPLGYPPQYAPQGYPPYFAPPPPPPVRRKGPVIAIVASILVVIALIGAGGAAVLLSHKGTPSGTPGAQTSYSGTNAAGPAATPTVTPDTNAYFQDNFSSNTSGWANDSHCFYGSDGYHIRDGYVCFAPTDQLANVGASADMTQIAGETNWFYGVVVRLQNVKNFYAMYVDSNGEWKFAKVVNGQHTDLIPYVHTTAIHTGLNVSNTITVRAVGSHFVFIINGVQVGQSDDSTLAKGLCGVEGNSHGQVEILVTRFTLDLLN